MSTTYCNNAKNAVTCAETTYALADEIRGHKASNLCETAIYLDMDGTIADLYGVNDWLHMLQTSNPLPYAIAKPLYDTSAICAALKSTGLHVGVISWTAKNGTTVYNREVAQVKRAWLRKYLPIAQEVHIVEYGTPKHMVATHKRAILIDDNKDVRDAWTIGRTIDATSNIITQLVDLSTI